MATSDLSKVRRMPGRLVVNPTSLSGSFPYGGTEMGRVRDVRWRWGYVYEDVVDEAWGEVVETNRVASYPFFAFVMETWDDDVLTRAFPSVSTSGANSARVNGGYVAPGVVAAIDKLLFVPTDLTNGKAVYIRRPILHPEETAETAFVLQELNLLALIASPTRDSAYATTPPWQIGAITRITL